MKTILEASGSFTSRKFLLTLLGLLLVSALAALAVFFPSVTVVLPTFIGGILGVLSLYFTGNVVNKYVVGKALKQTEDDAGDE